MVNPATQQITAMVKTVQSVRRREPLSWAKGENTIEAAQPIEKKNFYILSAQNQKIKNPNQQQLNEK